MSNQPILRGNTWIIEKHKPREEEVILVNITSAKQSVLMSQCDNTVVQVKGKCTKVAMEGCDRSIAIFDNIIASFKAVNCKRIQLQANGEIPEIQLDKCNGVSMYIQTDAGKKVGIYTSQCSELNVITPPKTPNSDPKEQVIPEQFETKFDQSGNLMTTPLRHVGI